MDITTLTKRCCSLLIALFTILLFAGATTVQAANDLELDGNILNDADGPPDAHPDWEDIFDVSGNAIPTEAVPLPAGYAEAVFVRDFVPGASGPDISTFTTGSKDTLNITPGWECTRSNNVNDKTDIVNAYATAKTNGDVIVYFALERYSNEGTGNVGFWFLKDGTTGCAVQETGPKTLGFTGNHQDGDTLIVAEFDNGGNNVNILAYRWDGGPGGSLNPTPIAASSKCVNGGYAQDLCGIVNGNLLHGYGLGKDVPWLTETKQPGNTPSNDLDVSEFFEGKINLTALNLVGCFTKYMAVTRSSTSLTATIFDYALGDFSLCSIDVTKACTVGVDPRVNTAGDKVITTYDVKVTNDGAGSVSDVAISEQLAASVASCSLISVDGDTTGLPVALAYDTPVVIKSTLAKDAMVVARVECEGANGQLNSVKATAKSVASSGTPDLSESYTMMTSQACPLNINPNVTLTKACDDVTLYIDPNSSILTMLVNVNISLKNNSLEKLINVDIDNQVGGTANSGAAIEMYYTDSSYNYTESDGTTPSATPVVYDSSVSSQFELAPGETRYFRSEYNPADVDGGVATDDSPGAAMFTDTVDATGDGAISGTSIQDNGPVFNSATCPLCPPDEN